MIIRKAWFPEWFYTFLRKNVFTDAQGNRMNIKFRVHPPFIVKVPPTPRYGR